MLNPNPTIVILKKESKYIKKGIITHLGVELKKKTQSLCKINKKKLKRSNMLAKIIFFYKFLG
jgi:hypothetical protein